MEKLRESIESFRFVSHKARMRGEFDSRKGLQSTKFEQRLQLFVKLSFREFVIQNYLVYVVYMAIIH